MNIKSTLEYIHKKSYLGSKPGLSRTLSLLEKIGNPHHKLKFVHIAGTNGKGSTCAFLSSILEKSGYKVGLYTSPYINVFNERMRIGGENISDSDLCEIIEFIKPFADSMTSDAPTEFEIITAAAFEYFYRQKCDIVVLEVGLGGEFDSTNVILPPECAVMCAIGLDHTQLLGDTVEKIAQTKSKIIKQGTGGVATFEAQDSVLSVIKDACCKAQCPLSVCDFSKLSVKEQNLLNTVFDYKQYKNLKISLIGSYQPKNACLAIEATEILKNNGWNIPEKAIFDGLLNAKWQGRFEILGQNPIFVLDGAHNPHGAKAAVQSFKELFSGKKINILMAVMADKDVEGVIDELLKVCDTFITVTASNDRAMSSQNLCDLIKSKGADAFSADSIENGVKMLLSRTSKDGVCAALGSLYFSSEVRTAYECLSNNQNEKSL